ncbi:MAG: sugar kinase [Alphaproteobacteria bacterium]
MRIATIGECMLELSGPPDAQHFGFGGDTLNTAIYLARLGVSVDYVTALGDDPFSDEMLAAWQTEGVGTDFVLCLAGRQPGLYIIRTGDQGERSFFYWRDQAPARELFDRPEAATIIAGLPAYDWLYLSGITLSLYTAPARTVLGDILDRQRARGGKVAFDSNYRPRGWPDKAAASTTMEQLLAKTDLALPTLEDEQVLYGDRDAAACAARIAGMGVGEIVVKQGGQGCLIRTGDEVVEVPADHNENAIDTTAAGDSFNAGYIAARMAGKTPAQAAACGHRLAATVIRYPGAIIPRHAMPQSHPD